MRSNRRFHKPSEKLQDRGIRGGARTPFLLSRLAELTGGRSLRANQSLILANARLAAQVAVELQMQLSGAGTA